MSEYKCINALQAVELIEAGAVVADIRDPQSYQQNHITDSLRLGNDNLQQFLSQYEFDQPLIICCYHGISSQSAAQMLASQGFEQVYSLDGGFEGWRVSHPNLCSQ